ncbi:MAG: hypothetical protein HMLKMBBP_00004 [Planctomycetes bacterium]|nr:hypothetical protein [Planctomycetota bacterium]
MSSPLTSVVRWFDTWAEPAAPVPEEDDRRTDWLRVVPFLAMHGACLFAFAVGVSAAALWTALALYVVRMFAITGFYHRYFSHRTFRTSRAAQFAFAVLGATSVQRGPLWWAAHHRVHHRHSDHEGDPHSVRLHGFAWSHMGWITSRKNFRTDVSQVPDLAKFPELRFLDRFDLIVPVLFAAACWGFGAWLEAVRPSLGTSGPQMLVWGFFVSTVVLFHATCTINSLSHLVGWRRFDTPDDSRNNPVLALLTLGEGWHNNHHHFPGSVRQGFRWWELDVTYVLLRVLALLGIVRDLRPVPSAERGAA